MGQNFGQGLPGALNSHARFVVLGSIVNEVASTPAYSALQIWDNTQPSAEPGIGFLQAIQQIVANGQTPILTGEYGSPGANAAQIAVYTAFNQIEREYCAETGKCIFLDFASVLWTSASTPSALSFVANSMQAASNIHPALIGGYLQGQVFDAALTRYVPPLSNLPVSLADSGLPNSNFATQTGGTLSGAGTLTSGTVPSGWTLTIPAGVSVVSTFVADPSGGNDWQLAITNTAGASPVINLTAFTTSGTAPVGSQYWGGAYVTTGASSTNYVGATAVTEIWNGVSAFQYVQTDYITFATISSSDLAVAHSYTAQTSIPLPGSAQPTGGATVTAAAQTPDFRISPVFTANGSATITIAHPWLRQVQGTNSGTVD